MENVRDVVGEKVGRIKGSSKDPSASASIDADAAAGGGGEESDGEIIAESGAFTPQGNREDGKFAL